MRRLLCLVLGVLLLVSGSTASIRAAGTEDELPVVGSAEKLKSLVKESRRVLGFFGLGSAGPAEQAAAKGTPSHSTTNVQVAGIDEADVVKTDGNYLYHIAGYRVLITRAWPVSSLAVVKELESEGFIPNTLYVDDNYLVVIGLQQEPDNPEKGEHLMMLGSTRVMIYDIRDKENIALSRDISLGGFNITSRKKGNFLYLVNTQVVGWVDDSQEPALPWYKDSASGDEDVLIDYGDIRYFPNGEPSEYVLCAAVDLKGGKMEVNSYLGWIQGIHMSRDNLYVAIADEVSTSIYRFSVKGVKLKYQGKGEVSGTPLNQFAMDEHDGYFRIATSEFRERGLSQNNVFVLNSKMEVVGKIQGIAPGETIFSMRFMGDRGYLVTYEIVDPLFVLDLSKPKDPKILGELKIPGFSTYLHPIDDRHLLGIGQSTEVRSVEGREYVTANGMKLAIFDVSDVNKPREVQKEIIGGGGTWSEAMYDHRAVFFHDGILALTAGIVREEETESVLVYQGVLFFEVDIEDGFTEACRISHLPESFGGWGDKPHHQVKRVVKIGDVYFTVSDALVMAHDARSFAKLAELGLPALPEPDYWR